MTYEARTLSGLRLDIALAMAERRRHMHNGVQCYVFDDDDMPHLFAPSTGPQWVVEACRAVVAGRIGPVVELPV